MAAALVLSLLIAPAGAQAPPGIPRVGFIFTTSPLAETSGPNPSNPAARAFVQGMRDLGYVPGRSVVLEIRTLADQWDRLEDVVAEFVRLGVAVIVAPSPLLVPRIRQAAPGTPIVMIGAVELLETGLVESLARPGGSITGVSGLGLETEAKRLELLLQILPEAKIIAFVGTQEEWRSAQGANLRAAARRMNVSVSHVESSPTDYGAAFARIRRENPDAFLVSSGPTSFGHRRPIGEFAVGSRVPSACPFRELAEHGCMISYGIDVPAELRRLAGFVDKILRGARPGDLPIERATQFEFVVNLRTARAIGVEVPRSILLRADRVIE